MADHPVESQREWILGAVVRRHPSTWEVGVTLFHHRAGARLRHVKVLGEYLPELHTNERQSKVLVGWLDAYQLAPVAIPLRNDMILDPEKPNYVYWSEHGAPQTDGSRKGYRITINASGDLEIQSLTVPLRQIRILDQDGVVRLDTPSVHAIFNEADKSARVQCDGDGELAAGGTATLKGSAIVLDGPVTIKGDVSVMGNLSATGSLTDGTGNSNHHSHP